MRFPRGRALKFPKRPFKKNSVDPERLSFFIVITFFLIFVVIVVMEFLYKEPNDEEEYSGYVGIAE